MNDNLKEFCKNHKIYIIDTNKKAYKTTKVNVNYFKNFIDYDTIHNIAMVTEPLYTIEIAESELERISDLETQVLNHMRQHGHYYMFEQLMEQKQKEKYLQDKYPAVKKAYDHYKLLLKLSESGEL
jgi:hypothetical protein